MAIILVAALIVAGYISPVKSYIERSRQIASERAAAGELKAQHDRLVNEKSQLQDNTYVEQVARRDLGLVKPGEQPFVLKDLNRSQGAESPAVEGQDAASAVDNPYGEPEGEALQDHAGGSGLLGMLFSQLH